MERPIGTDTVRGGTLGRGMTRRSFLKGTLGTAAVIGVAGTTIGASPVFAASTRAGEETFPDSIGGNLGGFVGLEFQDATKTSRAWVGLNGETIPLDENGWPLRDTYNVFFDMRPCCWFGIPGRSYKDIDDPEAYEPDAAFGAYHLSFTGQADVSAREGNLEFANKKYNQAINTTSLDVTLERDNDDTDPGDAIMVLNFADTRLTPDSDTNTGIKDVRMIRPGYPARGHSWPAQYGLGNQIFTKELLRIVQPFAALRYMSWLDSNNPANSTFDANGPIEMEWSARRLSTTSIQSGDAGKAPGVAWEHVVELANTIHRDAWINVPVAASDDYVLQLAKLMKSSLHKSLNVYVEYSNEVWNWGFLQYAWNASMAEQEVEEGDSNLNYDGTTDKNKWHARRVARRTLEIGNIFRSVFGEKDAARVRPVLGWFILPNNGVQRSRDMLKYVSDNYGPPSSYIYAHATTGYFDGKPLPEGATVEEMLDDIEAGIPTYYGDYSEVAHDYGLKLFAYEGGPETVGVGGGIGSTRNVANRIRAARTQRMGELLKKNLRGAWFPNGGDLFMHFTIYSGSYSRYGTWGATDDLTKPDRNYKYPALMDLIGVPGRSRGHGNIPTQS